MGSDSGQMEKHSGKDVHTVIGNNVAESTAVPFKGNIAEIAICYRAFTPERIRELYQKGYTSIPYLKYKYDLPELTRTMLEGVRNKMDKAE